MERLMQDQTPNSNPRCSDNPNAGMAFLAPKPRMISATGLSRTLLEELVAKHLYSAGVLDLRELITRTALAGPVLEEVLVFLRSDAHVEVRGPAEGAAGLRYALTDRGRAFAAESLMRSGYVGPAPVSVEHYARIVRAQSVHHQTVTRDAMQAAFREIVIREELLDQLGMALNSGRAMFVYGRPGTGKTYIGERLARLLGEPVLIPYAVVVDETPVQLFDPLVHHPLPKDRETRTAMLDDGFDPRFALCLRPAIVTGGELTLEMLETRYEPNARLHHAPLQLKANNGIYMIDDLGRQRAAPVELFNRWIVPLESRQDHLNLASGKRFPVPFDVVLIFSTNMNPYELADEAFLRRLGHKIHFGPLNPEEYVAIWRQICAEKEVPFDGDVLAYLVEELHAKNNVPLLACHPRDLLSMAMDESCYHGEPPGLTRERLDNAWKNYFVALDGEL